MTLTPERLQYFGRLRVAQNVSKKMAELKQLAAHMRRNSVPDGVVEYVGRLRFCRTSSTQLGVDLQFEEDA